MKIKNFAELIDTKEREIALRIAEAGLRAIDTESAIKNAVKLDGDMLIVSGKKFALRRRGKLFVVGVGKCSLEAAAALENVLGERIDGGIVVDVHKGKLRKIRAYHGTHPLPTEANVDATGEIIKLLKNSSENDFVIFIISGGGSTLLCQPKDHTCIEEAEIFKCLTSAGASIKEINTVRKHLSLARGGHLAQYAYPARSVALIFSDVPGDELEFIASGPTVKDMTTIEDAKRAARKYGLPKCCGIKKESFIETPKDKKYFEKVENILFISNKIALEAMVGKAKKLMLSPHIVTATLSGEAGDVGRRIATEISDKPPGTALLYGGETTVKIKNACGLGGRNQELALAALELIRERCVIISIASDGKDNTEHGGAICDKITAEKAKKLSLNPKKFLEENNSYEFFKKTGDYLMMGDTGANVSDLIIAIKF